MLAFRLKCNIVFSKKLWKTLSAGVEGAAGADADGAVCIADAVAATGATGAVTDGAACIAGGDAGGDVAGGGSGDDAGGGSCREFWLMVRLFFGLEPPPNNMLAGRFWYSILLCLSPFGIPFLRLALIIWSNPSLYNLKVRIDVVFL